MLDEIANVGKEKTGWDAPDFPDPQAVEQVATAGKPTILLTPDNEPGIVEQVVIAVGGLSRFDDPELDVYCRAGQLVRVLPSESPAAPVGSVAISPIPKPVIRELIAQAVDLQKVVVNRKGKESLKPASPPEWLVRSVAERGYWAGQVRPLEQVCTAPTLRPDGSILQTQGYDRPTGLIYRPSCDYPPVPQSPSESEVAESIARLLDVVTDFPFESGSDKSAWLAMVLTMIARPVIQGCAPMFPIPANIRGAGKSMLVDAASLISYGTTAARQTFTNDKDEQRKLITSVAIAGARCLLFDNLGVKLSGDALDAALTSHTWTDRVLGGSATVTLPMRTVFCATGNNLVYGSDLARRVLPIRLMSPEENPEERTGFRHPDLLRHVREHRARLAVDALTIVRAFIAAGKPSQPGGQFGSFESWSEIVRGAIVWAGLDDPLATRETAKAQDDDRETLGLLITALDESDHEGTGLTVKQLEKQSNAEDASEALLSLVGTHCPRGFNARTIGELLKKFKGRNAGGKFIEGRHGHGRVMRWRIIGGGWSGGSGGSVLSPLSQITPGGKNPSGAGIDPPDHPPHPASEKPCPRCGHRGMTSQPVESGWLNWDCPRCGHVKPERVKA